MGIPRRIGRVRPFAELARGVATSVFKAHDPDADRVVAVKLLRREWIDDQGLASRFNAETASLKAVHNKHVVAIVDHGECEDGLYLITEFVDGVALDRLLAERTVPSILGAFIVRGAMAGLAAVHKAGIIHRDFKPANIVVGEEGVAKLVDFGFAEPTLRLTGQVAGTPGYLAPELLTGGKATMASDLYSVGVTLLEASTGVRLTPRAGGADVNNEIAHHGSAAMSHLDQELQSAIRTMTDPEPGRRPGDTIEAIVMLDNVIESYRPRVTESVVEKWLAGEGQTLPRRMSEPVTSLPGIRSIPSRRESATAPSTLVSTRSGHRRAFALLFGGSAIIVAMVFLANTIRTSKIERVGFSESQLPGATAGDTSGADRLDGGLTRVIDATSFDTATAAGAAATRTTASPMPAKPAFTDSATTNGAADVNPPDSVAADPGSVLPADKAAVDNAGIQDLPALLYVTASPWANVAVDGEPAGVTPLANGLSVAAGRHVLTFSHPQFPDHEETVDLASKETTSVSISMWSTVARLHLTVSPWAEVLVDGIVRDTIPMTAPIIMRPGSSILTLRHPELGSWSETLFLQADSTYELRYNLYELTRRD